MTSYFQTRMTEIEATRANKVAAPQPRERPSRRVARNDREGYVYFYRTGNMVKIGFTTNLRERAHSLAVGCPEPGFMAKVVTGTVVRERHFHDRFAEYHTKGEWFELRGALAKYLERHIYPAALPEPRPGPPVEERIIDL